MTRGRLAIWMDPAHGTRQTFEAWYQTEHVQERLSIPGFRRARRWRTVAGEPSVFILYDVDSPEVLTSDAYLARLDDPTPWSKRIMTECFRNMNRTVCRLAARQGRIRGAFSAALRLAGGLPADAGALLAELIEDPAVACAEAWASAGDATESEESRLRGGDTSIGACLWVETLREADARRALGTLSDAAEGEPVLHTLLCEVTSADFA